ncbi:hypothetical protein B0H34DRAFT_704239 [Crassisporium funariophilum]|nr:hypothetical protein B0H34DRAFT_704239 [Crassisporium funariophilum]
MDTTARDEEAGLPGNTRAQRPRSSVPSFLFISFMLFMLTSHNGDEFLARHQYQDALQSLTYQLSNYTAWLNGTDSNFTVPVQDPTLSPLLDAFQLQGSILDPVHHSYYSNITGFIHGNAKLSNITLPTLTHNDTIHWRQQAEQYMIGVNTTTLPERLGSWNWTASTKVALSVVEKKPLGGTEQHMHPSSPITLVHGRIELTDPTRSENLRLEFQGVHFVSNGSIYGFAEPPGRHIDIRLLPSLVPKGAKNETARIIAPELQAKIDKLKDMIDAGIVDTEASANDEAPKTSCPFTFHAQINPVFVPEYLMQELEDELQNPTGIWTVPPPKLSISAVLLSKECGILYEITDTEGLRSRTFFRKVTTYAGLTGISYLILLILFSRQTERSRTPSGISRVSRWTFLAQATMDSVSFAGHITFAILAEGRPSLSLIAPAFLACMVFVHEAQFSALIHQIQGPESYTPPVPTPVAIPTVSPTQQPLLPTTTPTTITTPPPQLPTAVIAQQSPTTILQAANNNSTPSFFQFFIQHIRTDPQARLWFTLFIFLTFIVRVILSPTLSMLFVVVTYSSIWLPQIVRSVRRGRTSGLSKEYIIGTTACRLFSAFYFLACPKNVLEVEPRSWVYLLGLFVVMQAILVILQDTLGPTFFLPARYAHVKSYDYHPPMPLPDSESPEQSLGDCAICMDAITVDPSLRRRSKSLDKKEDWDDKVSSVPGFKKGKSVFNAMQMGVGATTARKNYSLAPCSHLFHTDCLEKWLAIKNICPQCRRPLPPL